MKQGMYFLTILYRFLVPILKVYLSLRVVSLYLVSAGLFGSIADLPGFLFLYFNAKRQKNKEEM